MAGSTVFPAFVVTVSPLTVQEAEAMTAVDAIGVPGVVYTVGDAVLVVMVRGQGLYVLRGA